MANCIKRQVFNRD